MDRSTAASLTYIALSLRTTLRPSTLLLLAYVLSMPAYALLRLAGETLLLSAATWITAGLLFVFALSHSVESRGVWRTTGMLLSALGLAFAAEYLGSTQGLIFGSYAYTDLLGFKLWGQVPAIIPLAWFMMLYPAWVTAGVLAQTLGRWARLPLAAAAITAWDLSLDPRMVADGAWVWAAPGALNYFGIPLSNFIGWFVTALSIYLIWVWLDRVPAPQRFDHAALPVVAYAIVWIGESMANLLFWGGAGVAAAVFVAMGVFAAPALRRLWRGTARVA